MITKQQFYKKTQEMNKNFTTKNWHDFEQRWLYHKQAIKWIKALQPKTILEIGGLGVKLDDKSDTLDYERSGWRVDSDWTYNQNINGELDIPHYDLIVALRVYHHSCDFDKNFKEVKKHCDNLILALPKEYPLTEKPDEMVECGNTNIYLWKLK